MAHSCTHGTCANYRINRLICQVIFPDSLLEARFPALVETQPELVAQHYTAAGCAGQAVRYWQRAGQWALERSAYVEATSRLTTGLDVLTRLAEPRERHQYELSLQFTLAQALHASQGQSAPQVEQAYARAQVLCRQVDDTPQLLRALLGLYRFYGGQLQRPASSQNSSRVSRSASKSLSCFWR